MARILLMDDDAQLRLLLERVLTQAGHEVHSAADGTQGLRIFDRIAPELVITDIVMPQTEGVGTIHALRRSGKNVPIIAISGNATSLTGDYLKIAEKIGADRTLGKPFRPSELIGMIDELLGSNQA